MNRKVHECDRCRFAVLRTPSLSSVDSSPSASKRSSWRNSPAVTARTARTYPTREFNPHYPASLKNIAHHQLLGTRSSTDVPLEVTDELVRCMIRERINRKL